MVSSKIRHTVQAVDEEWYGLLQPLIAELGETFVALMPSEAKMNELQQVFFASNHMAIPDLRPDNHDAESYVAIQNDLRELRVDISNKEANGVVKDLYLSRIDELVLNAGMIYAAKNGDTTGFTKANQALYGMPDKAVFAAACQWIRTQVVNVGDSVSQELRERVLGVIPDLIADIDFIPSNDVFNKVRSLHFSQSGYFDKLFEGCDLPDDELYSPYNSDNIVKRAIYNVGSDYGLTDSPVGLWAVLQSKGQVIRPVDFSLTKQAFMGIVGHEVGSHLLEATNGAHSQLRLLESGLDHYEVGNEGRAVIREQIVYKRAQDYIDQPGWSPTKASWEYRVAIHIAVSLAAGLHKRSYNFTEVYQVLTALFEFWTAKRGLPVGQYVIEQGAWNMAVRALKGTNGEGGAYYKDIVYLEGNVRCWRVAKRQPEMILWGDSGKFDITNDRHVDALKRLGILPNNLNDTLDS